MFLIKTFNNNYEQIIILRNETDIFCLMQLFSSTSKKPFGYYKSITKINIQKDITLMYL